MKWVKLMDTAVITVSFFQRLSINRILILIGPEQKLLNKSLTETIVCLIIFMTADKATITKLKRIK